MVTDRRVQKDSLPDISLMIHCQIVLDGFTIECLYGGMNSGFHQVIDLKQIN